jgi:pimeloyl-ACP methyl ester carboxylesterase
MRQDRNVTYTMPVAPAVLLPGTGSDEIFVRSVFTAPLAAVGLRLSAPRPPAGAHLAEGSLAALDAAADEAGEPILVGGISFGAHLATEWAIRNPARCAGVLAALPAWSGPPAGAPASLAAGLTADLVRREGIDRALALSTEGVAPWLAAELDRAWRRHGDGLAAGLLAAAGRPAATVATLRSLQVPVGIAACVDDPVHPVAVARTWAAALPRAAACETSLTALGADRESLGRAATLAWLRARSRAGTRPRPG